MFYIEHGHIEVLTSGLFCYAGLVGWFLGLGTQHITIVFVFNSYLETTPDKNFGKILEDEL